MFDLAAAIKAAQAIPTVTIPPGVYTIPPLRSVAPPVPVRIICTGVTFASLQLSDCANLSFEGLSVLQGPVAQDTPAVKLQNCTSVAFINPTITGTASADGLYWGKAVLISGGSLVSISGGEVSGFFKGVSLAATDDCTLSGVELHHVRTSPVNGYGQRPTISGNIIRDIIPDAAHGDHSDGIHFFTKGQSAACDGLTITGNRMTLANAGGTLGINLEGTLAAPFTNVRIVGNALAWNNNQGITTDHVQSGEISGNVLTPTAGLDDPKHAPTIILRPTNGPLKVFGNTLKTTPGMKPFEGQNTFLTAVQIAAYGAKA